MATTAAAAGAKPRRKGKRGQPTALDRPVPLHAVVLPSGQALAELIRTGLPIKDAAQALGLDVTGAYRCLGDGRVVAGLLWEGRLQEPDLTDYQAAALRYFQLVDQAEAEAAAIHTDALRRHALGGNTRTRVVETLDEDGKVVGKTVTTETLAPDVRASTFWLERRRPDLFGRVERREHALVGGDQQVGAPASPREKLAEALEQIARRKVQGAGVVAAMGGDVIDVDEAEEAATA